MVGRELGGRGDDGVRLCGAASGGLRKLSEAESSALLHEGCWQLILKRNHLQKSTFPINLVKGLGFSRSTMRLWTISGAFLFSLSFLRRNIISLFYIKVGLWPLKGALFSASMSPSLYLS